MSKYYTPKIEIWKDVVGYDDAGINASVWGGRGVIKVYIFDWNKND